VFLLTWVSTIFFNMTTFFNLINNHQHYEENEHCITTRILGFTGGNNPSVMPKISQYYVLLADMNPSVIWASVMLLEEFSLSNSDVVLTKHYRGIIPPVITGGLQSVSTYWRNNPSVILCQNYLSNTEGIFRQ